MGKVLFWLILIILLGVVGMGVWFGFQDVPLEQTEITQDVDSDALGL
ncbi:MAG: hypothetical protein AAF205_04505 [Pseudomonadota bacterium]